MSQRNYFAQVRDYLAGQLVGITRDDALLHEIFKIVLCMSSGGTGKIPSYELIEKSWVKVRSTYPELFKNSEQLKINAKHYTFIAPLIKDSLEDDASDSFGDLYEVFASEITKGAGGQFFTPIPAIKFLVDALDLQPGETIIDPACGAGGFLAESAKVLLAKGASRASVAKSLIGMDKDEYLSNLALARLGIITGARSRVQSADSLALRNIENEEITLESIQADVVLANPPFGAKIVAASPETLKGFSLGYKHKRGMTGWIQSSELQNNVSPQVLFVERIFSLVKPGGRIGIVLPESLVSSKSHGYVVQYIKDNFNLKAVIGMPESLFKLTGKTGTHTKTVLLIAQKPLKGPTKPERIFMAEVQNVGKDTRGRTIPDSEMPVVAERYAQGYKKLYKTESHLGYWVEPKWLSEDILAPRYYDPEVSIAIQQLEKSHTFKPVGELVHQGIIAITTGDEVGKAAYGTGDIPFVRTSDISNWEIKADPKHCVSEAVYKEYKKRQDVRTNDILMVRDGTYLIGATAIITKYDEKILYQSHILKIRVLKPELMNPFLLLALLSSDPVLAQIKSKRITQDIIDTLGDRLLEVLLPIPNSKVTSKKVAEMVQRSIEERMEAKELAKQARSLIVSVKESK
jgi:type I restriction enzyme M protein